ncbi:hypothetical protein WDJ51_09615 [Rathayibacter sp. YIM 133350]|uniref:PH-like domain-containing protein n=1 Tax=Rathayibacter sp. YIM 133350 TaxID=3131992 RepID=UPI00307ED8D7
MKNLLPVTIIVIVLLLVLAAMWWGWRARRRRDVHASAYPLPQAVQSPLAGVAAFYVATTRHELPLERLAIRGLDYRAKARLAVGADGVRLDIPGSDPLWIPVTALRGAGQATYAIDRVVEQGGLLCLTWQPLGSEHPADSYLRVPDEPERLRVLEALRRILPASASTESEA